MEKGKPAGWGIDTQGILEVQNEVLKEALAAAKDTQDPEVAKAILTAGQQMYFGLGILFRPKIDKRRGVFQVIRDLGCGVRRALTDGPRIMNNWE